MSISDHLINRGIAPTDAFALAKRFRDIAYPNGESLIGDLVVESPDVPFVATAFRETNVGNSRELDSSVVWKAIQSLNAAVDGLISASRDRLISNIDVAIDAARENNTDIQSAIDTELAGGARHFEIFHPVIVLDARLWVTDEHDELQEVNSARFSIEERAQFPPRWIDVVHRSHFESWLARTDQFFSQAFSYAEDPKNLGRQRAFTQLFFNTLLDPDLHIDLTLRRRASRAEARHFNVRYLDENGEEYEPEEID